MIEVSSGWKAAQLETLVPVSDIRIEYNVTDPGVQDEAVSTAATAEETFSSAADAVNEGALNEPRYATLEHNLWVLNKGHVALLEAVPSTDGFISANLSGADGVFAEIPTIVISFSKVHTNNVPGISVTWSKAYEEYATKFRIKAYNGNTEVKSVLVENNRSVSVNVWETISGYDKITIEILEWCKPYRRARLMEVLIGIKQVYTKADLMGFSHEQEADLLSGTLPKNSIVFELDNSDSRWNPDNPVGTEQYLIQRQTLTVRYGLFINGEMEWIRAGTFYMSEWDTPSNGITASFTARDLLEFCTDAYEGPRSGSLLDVAEAALVQSGIDMRNVVLSPTLGDVQTDFSDDDAENTCAEMLQMVANAGRCCIFQDRNGILRIEPLNTELTDYIIGEMDNGLSNAYDHPEFALTKELKSVRVNSGQGVATNSETGAVQEVSNPLITDEATANAVAEWCKDCLKTRKTLSGTFRADPRLDVLDKVTVVSKYSESPVYITSIKYDYNGAFRGTYEGRVAE
jgi:hypothetical protein